MSANDEELHATQLADVGETTSLQSDQVRIGHTWKLPDLLRNM